MVETYNSDPKVSFDKNMIGLGNVDNLSYTQIKQHLIDEGFIGRDVRSYLAHTVEQILPVPNTTKWIKLAEVDDTFAYGKFLIYFKVNDIVFGCDIVIMLTKDQIHCEGINSHPIYVIYDDNTKMIYLGIDMDIPSNLVFKSRSTVHLNSELEHVIIDSMPDHTSITYNLDN